MVALTVAVVFIGLILLDIAATNLSSGFRISSIIKRSKPGTVSRAVLSGHTGASISRGMFHHRGHMWAYWRPGGSVLAGADDLLHRVVGRLDEVRPPGLGEYVTQGEKVVMLRQGGRVMYLPAPVTGTVTAVNDRLEKNPGLVKESPYEDGWIFEVQPARVEEDLHHLMLSDLAVEWVRREESRMKYFVERRLREGDGKSMDGGNVEINGIIERLGDESWILFKDQFVYQNEWRT